MHQGGVYVFHSYQRAINSCHVPGFLYHLLTTSSSHSTKYGMYQPNCGLNNVLVSYGHDEYLYQTLVRNGCQLPPASLYIIRFHSLYPWHVGRAYDHLCNDEDRKMLAWVREFK